MFKAIHGKAPAYICNTVCFVHDVTGRNLRSFIIIIVITRAVA